MSIFDYKRRTTNAVHIGHVTIGSNYPIAVQSMTNTSTTDIDSSKVQTKALAAAGADIVRLTAQGVREAACIGELRNGLRAEGIDVPLVADIHFNPKAAFAAAEVTDKVRINPGNFVDPGRTFRSLRYTDEEYAAEIRRIEDTFGPFLDLCRSHGTAVRIGVNHGSLSDRIMSRYGDTPAGMVESAMEFLRVAVKKQFTDIVISIKASNVVVMVTTVRMLVDAMKHEGMQFPLHLGVTEAGDGDDGRVKSAVGIGALLSEGIGDTIRVSLSEDPVNEVPVARTLLAHIAAKEQAEPIEAEPVDGYNHITPERLPSTVCHGIGGVNPTAIVSEKEYQLPEEQTITIGGLSELTPSALTLLSETSGKIIVLRSHSLNATGELLAMAHTLKRHGINNPLVAALAYNDTYKETIAIKAAADFGALLLSGLRDAIMIEAPSMTADELYRLALGILQAARIRITRTEYIACPGCGRTLFDLQTTLQRVKQATCHLKNLKIGVMGCIVNGPGEMADADYGYVGAASGHVSLYKGKECRLKNIPQEEAIEHLIALIKAEGDWIEP